MDWYHVTLTGLLAAHAIGWLLMLRQLSRLAAEISSTARRMSAARCLMMTSLSDLDCSGPDIRETAS